MRLFLIVLLLGMTAFSFRQALANKHQCIEALSDETSSPEQTCACLFNEAVNNSALQAEIIEADGIPPLPDRSEAIQDNIESCAQS